MLNSDSNELKLIN